MSDETSRPLGLASNDGLGPNAPLLERLRSTAHWQLTEGNGDDATHQALQEAIAEIERLSAVVEAAQEWSGERSVRDWGDAELLKALWTFEGDRSEPCPECDGECGEPCAPCTVTEAHAGIDREIQRLVQAGKLHAGEPLDVCGNCDTALPTGCGGIFKDDGKHCRLNLGPNVRVKPAPTVGRQARDAENVRRTCIPGLVARRWGSA